MAVARFYMVDTPEKLHAMTARAGHDAAFDGFWGREGFEGMAAAISGAKERHEPPRSPYNSFGLISPPKARGRLR